MTAKEVARILGLNGFTLMRQKGSHAAFRHQDGRKTTVPMYSGDLELGTLKAIEKQSGVNLT